MRKENALHLRNSIFKVQSLKKKKVCTEGCILLNVYTSRQICIIILGKFIDVFWNMYFMSFERCMQQQMCMAKRNLVE